MRLFTATLLLAAAACGKGESNDERSRASAGSDGTSGSSNAPGGVAGAASSGGGSLDVGGSAGAAPGGAGAGAAGSGGEAVKLPDHPNIVVILTDDQGWNATSARMLAGRADSKSDFYSTPNIERLSAMGMTFSSGYGSPNCSPSRLSLLTGKTPARLGMTDIIERNDGENYDGHLLLPPGHDDNPAGRIYAAPAGEQTIAELVKAYDSKYVTAHFGKWHLAGGGPALHGFDESDGPTSNAEGQVGGDDPKLVFGLAQKSKDFIARQAQAKRPFYLQISHYATHEESFALAATIAKYQAKTPGKVHDDVKYAAMAEDLDTAIGRTLDALNDPNADGDDADSLYASTYVILLADNGGVYSVSDNTPLAWGKASTWEGGIRVPFMVSGPGIAKGSRSDVPVAEADILPTIADWLGAKPASKGDLDGGSLATLLRGTATSVSGRSSQLVAHFPHYQVEKKSKPMSSLRDGNYKLVHLYETGESLLFDLSTDLEEQHDVAKQHPQILKKLRRQLRDYLKEVKAPMVRLNPALGSGKQPDVDEDGLPDDWELRELLTTAYSGTDDPDGDGKDNATERMDKTDPLP